MPDQNPPDLQALVAPIAAALLPGWTVAAAWATQEELDGDHPGAMAICIPTPTRSMASIRVLSPWPATESLAETLWHELTHAALSPLTALAPPSGAAVMLQEQIVERFGVLLSKLSPALARVVARACGRYATPQAFARLVPLARTRDDEEDDDEEDDDEEDERGRAAARSGGTMDLIDLILAAVEAANAADDPKAAIANLLEQVKAMKTVFAGEELEPPSQAGSALGQTAPGMPIAARKGKLAAFARTMVTLVGAKSLAEAEGKIRAGLQDADVLGSVGAEAELNTKIARVVLARKYSRAELVDVSEVDGREVVAPKAWLRAMDPSAVDAMFAAKRARLTTGATPTGLLAPADGGGEEGLARRASQSGMTLDERRASEARINGASSRHGETR